ncbi:MAG: hypothetical protein JNM39_07690 [Bdellovibrionaceae bacterium]|nr:hypothetical protein [Pseudobdellovibrionaceae bacterium]
MKILKLIVMIIFFIAAFGGGSWVFINFYSVIFSKKITGEVSNIERLLDPQVAVLGVGSGAGAGTTGKPPGTEINQQIFSFSIGIRDPETSEIHVATTEDRQWAVVKPGQCVTARVFPYPPWRLYKGGTYFDARLLKLFDCPPVQQ